MLGRHVFLGLQPLDLTPELRQHFGVPADAGVMVSRLTEGGPAAAAGIQVGDILTAVDGAAIADTGRLADAVASKQSGDAVNLEVWRDGKMETVTATVAARERPQLDLGELMWQPEGMGDVKLLGPEEFTRVIELDPQTVDHAIDKLHEELGRVPLTDRLRQHELQREDLLERIEKLETRLKELEAELDKLPKEKR